MRLFSVVFRLNGRLRPQHGVIALSALLIAAYGASTWWSLWHARGQARRDAGAALESMARAAETATTRSLFDVDAMLIGIGRIVATVLPDTALRDPLLRTVLDQFNAQSSAVNDLLIVNDRGREVNRARLPPDGLRTYTDKPFFTMHRPGAPSALFIGAPQPDPTNAGWSMMLSRPLMRNGAMVGVIAAVVPIASFTDFYNAIDASGDARIELLLDNGLLVAGQTGRSAGVGHVPVSAAGLLAAAAHEPAGLIAVPPGTEGAGGLQAFRRIPGRPLIVSVSRGQTQILRRWHRERDASLTGFALFALTVAGLAWLAVRALRHDQFAAAYLRRSEARLKRQSSLLQSTLENIGEGLSVFNARGHLIARNRRFFELLDLPDVAIGKPLCEILTQQAVRGDFGDTDPHAEVERRLAEFYRQVPTIKERITSAGRILQIRRSAMPGGAVVSIYSDITEVREGERKILRARSQAELANRSKSEFLANMSHELRTPLNAIIGFTEIIAQELFGPIANEKYLEYMKDVHASSLHLLSIINDVLDMSKIEAGKLDLSKEAVILQNIVADVIRMMREQVGSRHIELVSQTVQKEVVVWADERALKQIILNLLSNAIKFSGDGAEVAVRVIADQPGFAVVEIEDHGIGMNEEELERALQPFGQAKPATTRNYGGTGLGLPITKGLVEAHGGTLTITSRPGTGTIVRFVLPKERAQRLSGAQGAVLAGPDPANCSPALAQNFRGRPRSAAISETAEEAHPGATRETTQFLEP